GWRRIVASPRPYSVVESDQIERLLDAGTIVIACGGGGTPVYRDERLGLEGVDAVVDKDRAACILARELRAEVLLILTNVDGAYRGYGTAAQQLIERLPAQEAAALLQSGEFGAGSMGPKVEAAIDFVRNGGRRAIIARLERGLGAVAGRAGAVPAEGDRRSKLPSTSCGTEGAARSSHGWSAGSMPSKAGRERPSSPIEVAGCPHGAPAAFVSAGFATAKP